MSRSSGRRISVVTLGCAKNQADTDLLAGQLLREGMSITGDPAEADAILVNTCAFLTASQQESIDAILQLAEHRRDDPQRRLVVIGCLAQRHGAELMNEIPEIDLLVGPGEVHTLAPRLRRLLDGGAAGGVHLGGMDRVEERWDLRVVSNTPHSAYVKVSEGCDRTCSFCVIPQLRGGHRSRTIESIRDEAARLEESGVRELNLVAQDLTAYGLDRYGRPSLADLLEALGAVEGIDWIRLLYTYPSNWTDRLFRLVREIPSVVPYVDLPIQHVSESILRKMRRPTFRSTRALLDRLRDEVPGVAIRTTLITGFPGETETDFREMLAFVGEFRFDALGAFAYSREEGTDAASMENCVDEAVAEERRGRLLELQARISRESNAARVGQRALVLIDRTDGNDAVGRHAGQAPEVDGCTRIPGAGGFLRAGVLREVVIERAGVYDLEACLARTTREGGS